MKNLKDYILNEAKEEYFVLFIEDGLESIDDFNNNLDSIEPECTLKSNDYNEDDDEIKVNGEWEFYASENTNYFNEKKNYPIAGDLVFDVNSELCIYRPGLNIPTGVVDNNALIGTKDEIKSYLIEFAKEFKSDYDIDVKKIFGVK